MTPAVLIVIAFGGLATYATRLSFVAFAERATALPDGIRTALRMIPPAALAALTVPSIVRTDGSIDPLSPRVVAGIVAAGVAWRTKSPVLTTLVGIGILAVFQNL